MKAAPLPDVVLVANGYSAACWPHPPWRTITFVAPLRHDGMKAPSLFPGGIEQEEMCS
jgi:hypothetical protein